MSKIAGLVWQWGELIKRSRPIATDTSTQIPNTPATPQHPLLLITYFDKRAPDRENCVQALHWFSFALPLKYRGGRGDRGGWGDRGHRGEGFCTPKDFPSGQKPTTEGNSSIFLRSAKYYHRLIAQSRLLIWLFILRKCCPQRNIFTFTYRWRWWRRQRRWWWWWRWWRIGQMGWCSRRLPPWRDMCPLLAAPHNTAMQYNVQCAMCPSSPCTELYIALQIALHCTISISISLSI